VEARAPRANAQAVFDLDAGEFAALDGGDSESLDPETASVLADLQDVDVNETPPVELLSKVQRWQERLEDWLHRRLILGPEAVVSTTARSHQPVPASQPPSCTLPVVGDSGRATEHHSSEREARSTHDTGFV